MTLNPPPLNPSRAKFLKRFAAPIMILGALFASVDFFHFYQQQNPMFIIMGTINLLIIAAAYYGHRMAVRHQLSRAAIALSFICIIPPPIMVCLMPAGRATLVLIPVFALPTFSFICRSKSNSPLGNTRILHRSLDRRYGISPTRHHEYVTRAEPPDVRDVHSGGIRYDRSAYVSL